MNYIKYIFFSLSSSAFSQVTGEWLAVETEIALPKKFSLENRVEVRVLNIEGPQVSKFLTQLGLKYQFHKQIEGSLKYRFAWSLEEDMHYYYRNKFMADLKFKYPAGQFRFEYRARFQRVTRTYITSERARIPTLHLRNKFAISYNVPDKPIEPAVFVDVFTPLNGYQPNYFDELQMGAELEYQMNSKHSFTGIIMYIHEEFEYQLSGLIFRLFYNITL